MRVVANNLLTGRIGILVVNIDAKTAARSVRDRTRGDEFVVNEAAVKIDEIDVVGDNDIADVERAAAVKAERAVDGQYGITADNERIGIQIGIARNGEALNLAAAAERKVGVIAEDNIARAERVGILAEIERTVRQVEPAREGVRRPERQFMAAAAEIDLKRAAAIDLIGDVGVRILRERIFGTRTEHERARPGEAAPGLLDAGAQGDAAAAGNGKRPGTRTETGVFGQDDIRAVRDLGVPRKGIAARMADVDRIAARIDLQITAAGNERRKILSAGCRILLGGKRKRLAVKDIDLRQGVPDVERIAGCAVLKYKLVVEFPMRIGNMIVALHDIGTGFAFDLAVQSKFVAVRNNAAANNDQGIFKAVIRIKETLAGNCAFKSAVSEVVDTDGAVAFKRQLARDIKRRFAELNVLEGECVSIVAAVSPTLIVVQNKVVEAVNRRTVDQKLPAALQTKRRGRQDFVGRIGSAVEIELPICIVAFDRRIGERNDAGVIRHVV